MSVTRAVPLRTTRRYLFQNLRFFGIEIMFFSQNILITDSIYTHLRHS